MMNAPIRIAHVMGKMVGGGVEQVVMNYYRHIDRSRVQFDFLVDRDSTVVPKNEIEELGGRVFLIPPYQDLRGYSKELHRLFKQEQWQIVHSHINTLSVFPLRVAARAGVPVRIAHSHSTSGKGEFVRNSMKWVLKHFANLFPTDRFACGDYAGKWLFGKNSQFELIYNAIDVTAFSPSIEKRRAIRSELDIDDSTTVVGHIGRFMKQKNHHFLLQIFDEMLKKQPNSCLLLAGTGELVNDIVSMADSMGIADKVKFLGRRSDVCDLYNAMDVFCLPSLYEGLPVVGVECQAARVPLVASSEVSRELRLSTLVKFEDLLADPSVWADDLIAYAGKTSEPTDDFEKFDIAKAANNLADLYERCVSCIPAGKKGGTR